MIRYSVSNDKYQKFTMTVREDDITVVLYYLESIDEWHADAFMSDGTSIAYGERMVGGIDIGFKFGVPGVFIADSLGNPKDPDSAGWSDLFFYILTEEELDVAEVRRVLEPTYLIDGNSDPLVDSNGFNLVVE